MSFYGQFLEIGVFSRKRRIWCGAIWVVWGNLGFDYLEYADEKYFFFKN